METTVIKIKCPYCGAVLAVRKQPGIEQKKVTCPVCKEISPFQSYRQIADDCHNREEHTQYAEDMSDEQMELQEDFTIGQLRLVSSDASVFRLKVGRNVIGRQASASSADIQLPMAENKRLSREHLIIEVKKVAGKGFVHYASLYKQKVNATIINDNALEYGDCLVLQHGDLLKLPDIVLRFELPDEEETNMN